MNPASKSPFNLAELPIPTLLIIAGVILVTGIQFQGFVFTPPPLYIGGPLAVLLLLAGLIKLFSDILGKFVTVFLLLSVILAIIVAVYLVQTIPVPPCCPPIVTPIPPTPIPPTPTRIPSTATPIPPSSTPVRQPNQCEIIMRDLPQTAQGIADKFGFATVRIAELLHENCGDGIIDGFVVRGQPALRLQVYPGGCIDAPPNATFSAPTVPNGVSGQRGYSGSVQAGDFTYRMFCY